MSPISKRALVLFSGGQDSATCLASALDRFSHVETIGFDYRQRHSIELACRAPLLENIRRAFPDWSLKLGPDHVIDLGFIGSVSETALTRDVEIAMAENGLPNTFVPGRNLLFLTTAAMLAYRRGLDVIVGGMCETDFSGYPDCRDETMRAMESALNLGMATRMSINTPLMWLTKADTWRLAHSLGGERLVEIIRHDTHTCYLGVRDQLHDWGYGCGTCPACELRLKGYAEYRAGA